MLERITRRLRWGPPHYRMRLGEWMLYHQREIVMERCFWMGKRAMKNPLDAWIYQEIVHETRPEAIFELGAAFGGSTLYLANLLDLLGEGIVVSIDHSRAAYDVEHPRIHAVTGDTRSPEVIEQVSSLCAGRRTMGIHDASHDADVVIQDLRNYSPLISPGCYFVVEDGIADLIPPHKGGAAGPGPLSAVRSFVSENADFEIDQARERYLITYNPSGYLRRKEAIAPGG